MKVCTRCSATYADSSGFCALDGAELAPMNDRFLGRTIAARYRLVKRLGSGGMSVVYLARHELISRLSAIKILRPELSQIAEHRERFLREARAVNRINHENIVEISDVGEADGVAYLVMEYIEGDSLLVHVQKERFAWPRAVRVALQVTGALARAHQMGVIHRDLKPENILLVPGASGDLVKLTDFGIAKMTGEPTLTMGAQLFGTPGYIAPEYVSGLSIDGRSDIYSLSVVLYEMVTGLLPFDARGQSEMLLKPLTTDPIPLGRRVAGLPPELEALVMRGLSREPADRPHDAFAFYDALSALLQLEVKDAAPRLTAPPAESRDALATLVDAKLLPASPGPDDDDEGLLVTRGLPERWSSALRELEARIAAARARGGESARAASRAAELAMVAAEMVPRLDRAAARARELQTRVDALESEARAARTSFGTAIDTLLHDRSRERAHLDAVRARRVAVADSVSTSTARGWEVEALAKEEARCAAVVDDLAFQLEALQRQLDTRNEELERALVQATGSLEGALSGVRHLTCEMVRTIDDGLAMVPST